MNFRSKFDFGDFEPLLSQKIKIFFSLLCDNMLIFDISNKISRTPAILGEKIEKLIEKFIFC